MRDGCGLVRAGGTRFLAVEDVRDVQWVCSGAVLREVVVCARVGVSRPISHSHFYGVPRPSTASQNGRCNGDNLLLAFNFSFAAKPVQETTILLG